jgi:hypothetical protein
MEKDMGIDTKSFLKPTIKMENEALNKDELYAEFKTRMEKEANEKSESSKKESHDSTLEKMLADLPEANRAKVKAEYEELTGGKVFEEKTMKKHFKNAMESIDPPTSLGMFSSGIGQSGSAPK